MDKNLALEKIKSPIWVSVIMSTYNDEKYIKETIESVLNQSYPYFEFIVINDGSTDNTHHIIEQFTDSRIIYFNRENKGLTNCLNFGIEKSKYQWIARMDHDDICVPTRLEEQIKYISEDVAVIGSQCNYINNKGEIIGASNLKLEKQEIIKAGISGRTMFIHPSVLINKNYLLKVKGYDPHIEAAEDLDLWLMLSHYGNLVNINKALINYRMHDNKMSYKMRGIQILNAFIAIYKNKLGIYKTISPEKYNEIKSKIEKNILFKITKKISLKSINASKISLKFYNFLVIISFKFFFYFMKK